MKITCVKVYIEADTKEEMILAQLKNNTERNTFFDYSNPVKEDDKYVSWYYDDVMKRPKK
jgi:hypothetical protein